VPFWPVAIIGGLVVLAVSFALGAILLAALGGPATSATFVTPVIIGLVFWIGAMFYAYEVRRRAR
jgi:uncharacterized membrane protein